MAGSVDACLSHGKIAVAATERRFGFHQGFVTAIVDATGFRSRAAARLLGMIATVSREVFLATSGAAERRPHLRFREHSVYADGPGSRSKSRGRGHGIAEFFGAAPRPCPAPDRSPSVRKRRRPSAPANSPTSRVAAVLKLPLRNKLSRRSNKGQAQNFRPLATPRPLPQLRSTRQPTSTLWQGA